MRHTKRRGPAPQTPDLGTNAEEDPGRISSIDSEADGEEQRLSLHNGLAEAPRWVAWREEEVRRQDGSKLKSKLPYNPHSGRKARIPSDPTTWGSRAQAEQRWAKLDDGRRGGIGIVLGDLDPDHLLIGIDLDRCIVKGTIRGWAEEVIERFNTYTEISPSGRGVKLFFLVAANDGERIKDLLGGKTRKAFVAGSHREMAIDRARFYAVTGDQLDDTPETFRTVEIDDVRWFIEQAGPNFLRRFKKATTSARAEDPVRDESGSGHAFRFLLACKRRGDSYETARAALLADQGKAGEWARRKDERDIERAWNNIAERAKTCELVCAADVVMRPIDWLWRGHLARGSQELTAGMPGLGKSLMHCSWVTTVTTGGLWPDGTRVDEPGNVIMVTGEDNLDQTVVPRLVAAGADLQRIHFLKLIRCDETKRRMFLLGEDVDLLAQVIAEKQAVLVTIDPITAFMGKINSHMTTDVRDQLGPLAELAERCNVAIATVTHPPKAAGARALDHFIGSQAFIAACRIAHLCVAETRSGDDEEVRPTGRVFVTNPKNNLSPKMPTLIYRTNTTIIGEDRSCMIEVPFTEWCGDIDLTADEAIAASKAASRPMQADRFLREYLAKGERWKREILKDAKAAGFTEDQMRRAKERIGAVHRKEGFAGWKWGLRK